MRQQWCLLGKLKDERQAMINSMSLTRPQNAKSILGTIFVARPSLYFILFFLKVWTCVKIRLLFKYVVDVPERHQCPLVVFHALRNACLYVTPQSVLHFPWASSLQRESNDFPLIHN